MTPSQAPSSDQYQEAGQVGAVSLRTDQVGAVSLRTDQVGAVATEYVLLASLIALVIAVGAAVLGEHIRDILNAVGNLV